jgi:hypothetical protein
LPAYACVLGPLIHGLGHAKRSNSNSISPATLNFVLAALLVALRTRRNKIGCNVIFPVVIKMVYMHIAPCGGQAAPMTQERPIAVSRVIYKTMLVGVA